MEKFCDSGAVKVLKRELAEAKRTIKAQQQTILGYEARQIRAEGVYLAACLKFGTEVAPGVMEMTLPTHNIRHEDGYGLSVQERPDLRAVVVRARRKEYAVC